MSLIADKLDWIWESWPATPGVNVNVSPRAFQVLTSTSSGTLERVLGATIEPFSSQFGVAIVGGRSLHSNTLDLRTITTALSNFLGGIDSEVEIVVIDLGDTPYSYVFVREDPDSYVQSVLARWSVFDRTYRECQYSALHGARLERYLQSPRGNAQA